MDKSTYLDLLDKDIRENVLKPYREQVSKDKQFFWGIIEKILIRINEIPAKQTDNDFIIQNIEKTLSKYGIRLKFYWDNGELKFEDEELPILTLDLLAEMSKYYLVYVQLVEGDTIQLMDSIVFLNRELKDDNIPLRIIAVGYANSDRWPGELEIVKISDIKYDLY